MKKLLLRTGTAVLARPVLFQVVWLAVVVAIVVALPALGFAGGPNDGGGAFDRIGNVARTIYGWLKVPALGVAIFIGAIGLFKWLIQGATNARAHKQGLELVLGVIIMIFLIFTLDGLLSLVTSVGNDVSNALKDGGQ